MDGARVIFGRQGILLAALALGIAACAGVAGPSPTPGPSTSASPPTSSSLVATASASASVAPPVSVAPSATVAPSPSPSPSPSRSPSPSAVASEEPSFPIDWTLCPAALPPADAITADGIQITGDARFIAQVGAALDLLRSKAPGPYADVLANIVLLHHIPAGSGMCVDTGRFKIGEETAYAPGWSKADQIAWLAGAIVHDANHRARYRAGLLSGGRDAELDCLQHQLAALRLIGADRAFREYLRGIIEGIDDPANQYWNDPNRHW